MSQLFMSGTSQLFIVLILLSVSFAQEVRRPTVNTDGGAQLGLGCSGTNQASSSMPNAYDGAGLATSSNQLSAGDTATRNKTRIFSSWQSTGNVYTSLSLNVNSTSGGHNGSEGGGQACLKYSIDSGASWVKILCDSDLGGDGWAWQTSTITLSANQNLAYLRIGVCTQGNKPIGKFGTAGEDDISLSDIWTSGTSTPVDQSGAGPSSGNAHRGTVIVN